MIMQTIPLGALTLSKIMSYIFEKIKFLFTLANGVLDAVIRDVADIAGLVARVGIKIGLFLLLYQAIAGDLVNKVLEAIA